MISKAIAVSSILGLFSLGSFACNTGVVQIEHNDGGNDPGSDSFHVDHALASDMRMVADLTAKSGDPCTYGKCAAKLICMANICVEMCSGSCGQASPECPPGVGCYWASDFSGACLPGTAKHLETCKDGVFCEAGTLCVTTIKEQPPKCLKLCETGCPVGSPCVETNSGCKICLQ